MAEELFSATIFIRTTPTDKARIVNYLKRKGVSSVSNYLLQLVLGEVIEWEQAEAITKGA